MALPVPVARFSKRNVSIRIFIAKWVFLASVYIFRPVARVGVFVVQQTADAELLRRSSVPAGPVACARRLVSEDAVEPAAVFLPDRPVSLSFPLAVIGPPGVVASFSNTSVLSGVNQAVGTVVKFRLAVLAFPVAVAVCRVCSDSTLTLARVILGLLLA